jgi:hypothetical protein
MIDYERVIYFDADTFVLDTNAFLSLFVDYPRMVLRVVPSPSTSSAASDTLHELLLPTDASIDVTYADRSWRHASDTRQFMTVGPSAKGEEVAFQTALLVVKPREDLFLALKSMVTLV